MDPNFISIITANEQSAQSIASGSYFSHFASQSSHQIDNSITSIQFAPVLTAPTQPTYTTLPQHGGNFVAPVAIQASSHPQCVAPQGVNTPMMVIPMQAFSAPQQTMSPSILHPGINETLGPMIVGGRLRHGGNAHTDLKHVCKYYSYRDGDGLKDMTGQPGPKDQVLSLFVQMFPSEHKDHAAVLFERVLHLICGPGAGTIVGIEPRSDTSFIAFVRTGVVWHVLYNLRCRALMDRHGFWYAENKHQYALMRDYCESVRMLPQQTRHAKTDGMPSMPLVLELSRAVSRASITAPPAPAPFDIQMPWSSNSICS